ncbi:tetratricopeptide repeat protein [Nodosilinea sp. LEGE 07088]|uniref:tetratricopeptide repeat protein n=1 Tax=Nodosilinea sp. LEGE 07088 TaxID=2777968 RepID=UPI00187FB94A|nr:tetratricopeptide repeat protein [Nodosilinea sp. LEGE 07088]MBE9138695.1 tetratricopeptide repeat protein [Nodosilinea sp. LEGE 07088]
MYDLVSAALGAQQLTQAAQLIKQWQQKNPQDPWLKLAMGNYWEVKADLERAQITYARLLQNAAHPKVLSHAREGMQRVRDRLAQQREHDLSTAKHQPGAEKAAALVLEPVTGDRREPAAQGLAQVMQIDPYTARTRLPSKQWRLLRVGTAGELRYFCEQLTAAGAPARWVAIDQIKDLSIFRVQAIQAIEPQLRVICQNSAGQQGTIELTWSDITQWVVGQLPIYESVVDLDARGRLKRKDATQDYSEIMDWHLHGRGCVLRFCDRLYRYRDAMPLPPAEAFPSPLIAATAWKAMMRYCGDRITPEPITDFSGFGESALDLMELLPTFESHVDLGRSLPSPWDSAFHLYSGLRFWVASPG